MPPRNRIYMRRNQAFSPTNDRTFEVGLGQETTPADDCESSHGGLTEPDRGSAVEQDNNVTRLRRQLIAVEYLELSARKLIEAKRGRVQAIIAARAHGVANQTIADALGITESAVRGLLERNRFGKCQCEPGNGSCSICQPEKDRG